MTGPRTCPRCARHAAPKADAVRGCGFARRGKTTSATAKLVELPRSFGAESERPAPSRYPFRQAVPTRANGGGHCAYCVDIRRLGPSNVAGRRSIPRIRGTVAPRVPRGGMPPRRFTHSCRLIQIGNFVGKGSSAGEIMCFISVSCRFSLGHWAQYLAAWRRGHRSDPVPPTVAVAAR